MMPRRLATVFRILAAVLTATAAVIAILFWSYWQDLRQCSAERPLDMTLDLSQPGEFSSRFAVKYPFGYGYDLKLLLADPLPPWLEGQDALLGFEMDLSILDSSGILELAASEFRGGPNAFVRNTSGQSMTVMRIRQRFPEGEYTIRVKIPQGLPALSAVKPRLVMVYLIDFEALGPVVLAGWGAMALSGAVLCACLVRVAKAGRNRGRRGNWKCTAFFRRLFGRDSTASMRKGSVCMDTLRGDSENG